MMNGIEEQSCGCSSACQEDTEVRDAVAVDGKLVSLKYILIGIPLLVAWWLIYKNLQDFAHSFTRHFMELVSTENFRSALEFFVYDTPKMLMFLTLVVFGVGVIRSFFTPGWSTRSLSSCSMGSSGGRKARDGAAPR